jgi:hypothetical protein
MNHFTKEYPSWLDAQRVSQKRHQYMPDDFLNADSLRNPFRIVELIARLAQLAGIALLGYLAWLIGRGLGVW